MNLNLNLLNHTRIRISSPQFLVVVGACRLSSSAVYPVSTLLLLSLP